MEEYQHLDDLIRTKRYEELTLSEKSLVEKHFTEEEYELYAEELHQLILSLEEEEQNLVIRDGLKADLLEAFDHKNANQPNFIQQLLNLFLRPVFYRTVAIGFGVVLFLLYINTDESREFLTISDEEFIYHTQFINKEMPASTTTEQLENMDFLHDF